MKKVLILLVSIFAIYNSNLFATNSDKTTLTQPEENYPEIQVCKFSLNRYGGKIYDSNVTDQITVKLSCPQAVDVRATVTVYVDGYSIASEIFIITAGKDESDLKSITVPEEYKGKQYRLEVE